MQERMRLIRPTAALLAATLVGVLLVSGCNNAPGPSSSENPYAGAGGNTGGAPPASVNGGGGPGMGNGPGSNGGR